MVALQAPENCSVDVPDAVAYVSYRPTNRKQALEMLANISFAAGR
jgi:hypothetical protein